MRVWCVCVCWFERECDRNHILRHWSLLNKESLWSPDILMCCVLLFSGYHLLSQHSGLFLNTATDESLHRNFFLVRLNRVLMEKSIVARLLGEARVYSRVLEVGIAVGFGVGVGKGDVECRL